MQTMRSKMQKLRDAYEAQQLKIAKFGSAKAKCVESLSWGLAEIIYFMKRGVRFHPPFPPVVPGQCLHACFPLAYLCVIRVFLRPLICEGMSLL